MTTFREPLNTERFVDGTDSAAQNDSGQEEASWNPDTVSGDGEEVPADEVDEHV